MKLLDLLGKGVLVAGVAAAGIASGNWAANQTRYRVAAPRADTVAQTAQAQPDASLPAPATTESLLHYRFTPGDRALYKLNADISGAGIESLVGSSGVAMGLNANLQVYTERVDDLGHGYLEIRFDRVQMQGSFMGEPISAAGVPQSGVFDTPTRAVVSPAGQIIQTSGEAGVDQMLSPATLVTSVQFPAGDLDAGSQWESDFNMPVPGLRSPVVSKAVNTLVGFDLYRGRYCALIRQTMTTQQRDGQISTPPGALDEGMNFSMPEFSLQGENQIYFDVENGKLVQADLDLQLTMKLGGERTTAAEMLGLLGTLLNEIEGGTPGSGQPQGYLLNLGLKIRGALSIVDP